MGTTIFALCGATRVFRAAVALLLTLYAEFNAAISRASESPGLPNPQSTEPYWQKDPPFPELVNIRSPTLPEFADVAIIGSGIAGAAVARSLLRERRRIAKTDSDTGGKVIVFEARQLCSGATSRNGGHIKPAAYEAFRLFGKSFPPDRAAALARFQLRHISCLTELCAAEGIEVAEARAVETADLYLDEKAFQNSVQSVEEMKRWIPEVKIKVWKGVEAREKFGANDSVVGALSYRAGAIWAYRFVASIWKGLLDDFPEEISIETTTPVQSISTTTAGPSNFPYAIQTSRGVLHVRHVVHATNGFASHLVPALRSKITGVRAHMSAQRPGEQFPNCAGNRSWGVVYGEAFDYVTQRPSLPDEPQGDLMVGGGFARSLKQGVDQVGLYDDGTHVDALTTSHISGIFPAIFSPSWGNGSTVKQVWSGILGMTGDLVPFVGRLDEGFTGRKIVTRSKSTMSKTGEWISAGFSGEGMVWAWLSGMAVGIMIAGVEEEDLPEEPGRPGGKLTEWFPRELLATSARIQSADVSHLAD